MALEENNVVVELLKNSEYPVFGFCLTVNRPCLSARYYLWAAIVQGVWARPVRRTPSLGHHRDHQHRFPEGFRSFHETGVT